MNIPYCTCMHTGTCSFCEMRGEKPRSHTSSAAEKAAGRKMLRDLYEDRSSPHRAEALRIIVDALRDVGIPEKDVARLAEESLRNAAYRSDEDVNHG